MSARWLEDAPAAAAQDDTRVEVRETAHGLFVHVVSGKRAKAEVLRRIAARQLAREREAESERKRTKREALGRSNARPGRRGGAA